MITWKSQKQKMHACIVFNRPCESVCFYNYQNQRKGTDNPQFNITSGVSKTILTCFHPIFHFYTPLKRQKAFGFL